MAIDNAGFAIDNLFNVKDRVQKSKSQSRIPTLTRFVVYRLLSFLKIPNCSVTKCPALVTPCLTPHSPRTAHPPHRYFYTRRRAQFDSYGFALWYQDSCSSGGASRSIETLSLRDRETIRCIPQNPSTSSKRRHYQTKSSLFTIAFERRTRAIASIMDTHAWNRRTCPHTQYCTRNGCADLADFRRFRYSGQKMAPTLPNASSWGPSKAR